MTNRWKVELLSNGKCVQTSYFQYRGAAENAARNLAEWHPTADVVTSEKAADGTWWARAMFRVQRKAGKVAWSVERIPFKRKEMLGGMDGSPRGGRFGRGRIRMTRELAWAHAMDEANRSMRKAGRTCWNRTDMNLAVKTFNRLWPQQNDLSGTDGPDDSCSCAPPAVSWVTLGLSVATTAALGVVAFQTWKVLRGAQQVLEVVDTVHGAVKRLAGTA